LARAVRRGNNRPPIGPSLPDRPDTDRLAGRTGNLDLEAVADLKLATERMAQIDQMNYLQLTEQPRILLKSASLDGWNASVKLNVMPRIGLLADFSGYYGRRGLTPYTINSLTVPGELVRVEAIPGEMRQHTFLFEPEVRL
jgi:hypothetical protein